jgi:hypothetical protein
MQVSRAVESEQGTQALAATQVSTLQVTNHTDTHMGPLDLLKLLQSSQSTRFSPVQAIFPLPFLMCGFLSCTKKLSRPPASVLICVFFFVCLFCGRQAEVPLEEVRRRDKESYRTQASHALQRLLHAHQEAEGTHTATPFHSM